MKILVSAFACRPNAGSEGGVGWRWATELARAHEVVVVTDVTRREDIERDLLLNPQPNIRFVFFRPAWLRSAPLNSSTAQLLYSAWQFALLPFARKLHAQHDFDFSLHITYSVFRHPSFLGFLGIPFVFGPLGGGEDAPLRLKKSIRGKEKLREIVRTCVNKLALFDPFLWLAYSKASVVLVATDQTRKALPLIARRRAICFPNLGVDPELVRFPSARVAGEPLRLLFVGHLFGLKGVHLAIRAFALALSQGASVEFTLLGEGGFGPKLRHISRRLGVELRIKWIASLPLQGVFELYAQHHCFLFPSLHDSGGSVVLEAQLHGLPVICLDLGGPPTLLANGAGIVVSTAAADEETVVERLAEAICQIAANDELRVSMGRAGAEFVSKNMSWRGRVEGMLDLLARQYPAMGCCDAVE